MTGTPASQEHAADPPGRPGIAEVRGDLLEPAPRRGIGTLPPSCPGAALFAGRDANELLRALGEGDPLHLQARAARGVREEAYLLEIDRVQARALARVALAGPAYGGEPALEGWLRGRVEEAIADLLREDREELRLGHGLLDPSDARFVFLTQSLGIEPGSTLRASVAFNGLTGSVRRSFFSLAVEGKSVDRCLAEGLGTREELFEGCRVAFRALFGLESDATPGRIPS